MLVIDGGREPIEPAVEALRNGEVIAVVTETLFGLACDARNAAACSALCDLKGRAEGHTLPIQIATAEPPFWPFALPSTAALLFACFAPGPLTVVIPSPLPLAGEVGRSESGDREGAIGAATRTLSSERNPHPSPPPGREEGALTETTRPGGGESTGSSLAPQTIAANGTIALRIPDHPITLMLLRAFGGPIACTSANPTGMPGAETRQSVQAYFAEGVSVLLYGDPPPRGVASTIVDVTTERPTILREGSIGPKEIARCLDGLPG